MRNQDFEKTRTAIRYWMQGRNFHTALRAMEFGAKYHTGVRKDGKSPEYQHQISQANLVRTLESTLIYPEETIATVFLHDVCEDYGVPLSSIYNDFGDLVGKGVELMTNKFADGSKKSKDDYYMAMVENPIASMAKGIDRTHNHQTMVGVFSQEKQDKYIEETEEFILPMLKSARKRWTEQEPAYQNVSTILRVQIELIQSVREDCIGR
jgi:(p)ppGpp synthase/HD superfamily hydrolase